MNVVIFGQKWFAAEVLKRLCEMPGVKIVAVCPDKVPDRLAGVAQEKDIPVVDLEDAPLSDLGIAAYCQRFIPAKIRERCKLGVLAYHPSLLPRHRGRDAVRWTVAMRDPIAGGTVYWMDDGADTGPIEAQGWCHVLPGETARDLWQRALAPMGIALLTDVVLRLLISETPRAMPQEERVATFEPAFIGEKLKLRK
ncbi:MAG: formyltransferase family protein [Desulfovibrio sp.]|jgi:methionyl-tRNA formyltransferase|nr:formyltransferase family protein [Desulfovibrio sp.]